VGWLVFVFWGGGGAEKRVSGQRKIWGRRKKTDNKSRRMEALKKRYPLKWRLEKKGRWGGTACQVTGLDETDWKNKGGNETWVLTGKENTAWCEGWTSCGREEK